MNIKIKQNSFEATFTKDELLFIHQAFNEICHGIRVENFDIKIGASDEVKREMQKLADFYKHFGDRTDADTIKIILNINQIKIHLNVINAVCEEIEEWEFQTRTGETLAFARAILTQLRKILAGPHEK